MPARLNTKGLPPECYTIDEFCRTHRLGRSMYYKLRDEGRAPTEVKISDNKVLITKEAAARWRAARDEEAGSQW